MDFEYVTFGLSFVIHFTFNYSVLSIYTLTDFRKNACCTDETHLFFFQINTTFVCEHFYGR